MRHRLLLALTVQAGCDLVAEDERVPGEAASRPECRGHAFECATPVAPGRQMQQGSERAIDQCRRLVQRELTHVALPQIEVDASLLCRLTRLGKHRRRSIDPDHTPSDRLRHRHRGSPGPDRKLNDRPVRLSREVDVERDVLRHLRRPLLVDGRKGRVLIHEGILRYRVLMAMRPLDSPFTRPRLVSGDRR